MPEKLTLKDLAPYPIAYRACPAKVNIGLFIKGRRPDGYHDLETVFYPVTALFDDLTIQPAADLPQDALMLSGQPVQGPTTHNLVVRALALIREAGFDVPALRIRLHKRIPAGAGLGGGSSNAAQMLLAVRELFQLNLSVDQLIEMARSLGADVPFFLQPKPVLATGTGDHFADIQFQEPFEVKVVTPGLFSSTAEAYRNLDLAHCTTTGDLAAALAQPFDFWHEIVVNDFEHEVFQRFPVLPKLKQALYNEGAVYAAMTGSGSAMFGLFRVGLFAQR